MKKQEDMRTQKEKVRDRLEMILTEFSERAVECETADERLALLCEMANRRVPGVTVSKKARFKLRRKFNRQRSYDFAMVSDGDWRPCFVCWNEATHRHHVVMLHHGGSNKWRNIRWVCKSCHERIHPWMQSQPLKPLAPNPVQKLVVSIETLATHKGGWTRDVLAGLGVPWPPPRGWKRRLERAALLAKREMKPRLVTKAVCVGR